MATLSLSIEPDHAGPERLDQLTRQLFSELRASGGLTVEHHEAVAPERAKSGAASTLGQLIIGGALSASSLSALAGVVIAWIKRTGARSVTVRMNKKEYTFTALSAVDQRALIERLVADATSERDGGDTREPRTR